MLNMVLFGPPGAGKGTQSKRLIDTNGLMHLSTGDILRCEIADETALGIQARKRIDKGEYVPDEIVISMISNILDKNGDAKGFIFDGFPRTTKQAEALDMMLTDHNMYVNMMILLDVDEEELKHRLLARGATSRRADDQDISIIEKRINIYRELTEPVISFYRRQGKYFPVNGMQTEEEVFSDIEHIVKKFIK